MNIFSPKESVPGAIWEDLVSHLPKELDLSEKVENVRALIDLLHNSCNGLLQILDSLPVAIYIADKNGKTVFINQTYSSLTGISLDEVLGLAPREIEQEGKLFIGCITEEVIRLKSRVSSMAVLIKDGISTPAVTLGCPILDQNGELLYAVTAILNTNATTEFTFHPQPYLYSGEQMFAKKYGISPRELDLIDLMFYGFTYEQAAEKLYISINTVRAHMRNIYRKTDKQNLGTLLQHYKDFKCFNLISFPQEPQ